jgi:hypothetical protein
MILLNLFIGLVGGVLYLISRRVDRAKESLQKIAKYLLNELLLILGIFNAMNTIRRSAGIFRVNDRVRIRCYSYKLLLLLPTAPSIRAIQ